MNNVIKILLTIFLLIILLLLIYIYNKSKYFNIPNTISKEAQNTLKFLYTVDILPKKTPSPTNIKEWKKISSKLEEISLKNYDKIIEKNNVKIIETNIGNVPVLDIRPTNWIDNGKLIIYTHGGAFTQLSAKSSILNSAPMVKFSGCRIISVDYLLAPEADWKKIQQQLINVFKDILSQGYNMKDIGYYGDSAGGGLAVSTVLNLRDAGYGLPSCLILMSPWVDLTGNGDTYQSLKRSDPILDYEHSFSKSALAYANGLSLDDSKISPLYADFSKGFPPTLIIVGTKDIFLSTCVILYKTLQKNNIDVKLDLYEGMWHVFTYFDIPESGDCFQICADFFNKYLHLY